MVDYSFFNFWVNNLWGSGVLALFGTGLLFALIGIAGRMSYMLLFSLLVLYFVTFGVGFFGIVIYLPLIILSFIYFLINLNKFLSRE